MENLDPKTKNDESSAPRVPIHGRKPVDGIPRTGSAQDQMIEEGLAEEEKSFIRDALRKGIRGTFVRGDDDFSR